MPDQTCPKCSTVIRVAAEFCPNCLSALGAAPVADAAPVPALEALPSQPVESAPPCAKHPDRPVIGSCTRCGAFICVKCAPEFLTHPNIPCDDCQSRLEVLDAPKRIKTTLQAAGGAGLLYGLAFGVLIFAAATLRNEERVAEWLLFVISVVFASPYLILGGLMLVFRKRWMGWTLFALQLLGAPLITDFQIRSLLLWMFIGIAVFTWSRLQEAAKLQELAEGKKPETPPERLAG